MKITTNAAVIIALFLVLWLTCFTGENYAYHVRPYVFSLIMVVEIVNIEQLIKTLKELKTTKQQDDKERSN